MHDPGHRQARHDHAAELRRLSRRRLAMAMALITAYMLTQVIVGWYAGSLALLANAGHMLTHTGGLGLAILATWLAEREASAERTFGFYRTEVLAVMVNAGALMLVAGLILIEAYNRFQGDAHAHAGHGHAHPEGLPILLVGAGAVAVNLAAAWVLHGAAAHSFNAEGAFRHVLADLLSAIGVIVSGAVILLFDWELIDPLLSVFIGVLILLSALGLARRVFHVLLEGTPEHIDMYELCHGLEELEGVTLVHDVHVWTITSRAEAFTAHVLLDPEYAGDVDALLERMQHIVHTDYDITHATFQLERSLAGCLEDHHIGHLMHRTRGERRNWSPFRFLLPSA